MTPVARPDAADTADVPWPDDAVEVGKIGDAWGVKGWFKVHAFASDSQALFSSKRWFVRPPEAAGMVRPGASVAPMPSVMKIIQAKEHGDTVVAQAQGVVDRSGAEALRGVRIFVGRGSFPTAGADEFYWVDLLGLDVVNREGQALGRVLGLLDTGAHSVLRVGLEAAQIGADSAPDERLIPFVAAYVDDVSLAERRITVDWGLDY
jgi:16S rRNA processing protein RimM